jgi:hypothetical protein
VAAREWEKRRNVFSIPTDILTVSVEVSPPTVSPAGAEYSPAGDQPLPSPPVEGPAEPGDRLSPSPQGSSAPVADAPPRSSAADDRRAGLVERYRKLTDDQKRYYTAHKPNQGDLDAVEAAIAALEFKPRGDKWNTPRPQPPAEGAAVDDADFALLQKRYAGLDDATRSWFSQLIVEANDADVDFKAHGHRTVRRYELYRGLIALGEYREANPTPNADELYADEIMRSLVHEASNFDDAVMFHNVTPGQALGSLDAVQARTFSHLVDVYVSPLITT